MYVSSSSKGKKHTQQLTLLLGKILKVHKSWLVIIKCWYVIVGHKAKMLVATRTYDSAGTPHPLAPLVYMRYSKVKILVFYASENGQYLN